MAGLEGANGVQTRFNGKVARAWMEGLERSFTVKEVLRGTAFDCRLVVEAQDLFDTPGSITLTYTDRTEYLQVHASKKLGVKAKSVRFVSLERVTFESHHDAMTLLPLAW